MDKADQPPAGGIVTGSGKSKRAPFLRAALIVLIILVAAALVGGAFMVYRLKLAPAKSQGPTTATKPGNMTPAQALKVAQAELQTASTPAEKASAYTAIGDAYQSGGQASQSSTAYQQALTYSPDSIELLERLSSSYEDAGDKTNAVATLQKLVTALQSANIPSADRDFLLSRYQAELQYEQGGN